MTSDDIAAIDAFICAQRLQGSNAIDAIKAVRQRFQVGLGIAKGLVECHPAWFSIVEANRPFQELAEQVFAEKDSTPQ